MNNYKYIVRSRFDNVYLTLPINWRQDPFNNKNWMHHFMSLRWILKNDTDPQKLKLLLTDFYNYHLRKESNNPYYNSLRGDHTAAERMNGLCKTYSKYENYHDLSLYGIIVRLIKGDIGNLLSESMYREGHNHALMVDMALINCFIAVPDLRPMIDLEYVVNRAYKTLLKMFYNDGMTRENSISYQEYNYNVVESLVDKLEQLKRNIDSSLLSEITLFENIIRKETKKILGYSLRNDGTYLELGDTFSDPKPKVLQKLEDNKLYPTLTVEDLLKPYSIEGNYYINHGLILYRYNEGKNLIHFGQTIMYGSNNHKQNDELSFCLSVNGDDIFIDPGYSTSISSEEQKYLRTSLSHSTLNVLGKVWENFELGSDSNQISNIRYVENELSYTLAHKRIKDFIINLEVSVSPKALSLKYKSDSKTKVPSLKINRFILSSSAEVKKIDDSSIVIKTLSSSLRFTILGDIDSKILIGETVYIRFNSDLVTKKTKTIDILYYSDNLDVQIEFSN